MFVATRAIKWGFFSKRALFISLRISLTPFPAMATSSPFFFEIVSIPSLSVFEDTEGVNLGCSFPLSLSKACVSSFAPRVDSIMCRAVLSWPLTVPSDGFNALRIDLFSSKTSLAPTGFNFNISAVRPINLFL